jgi:hypothetical protein
VATKKGIPCVVLVETRPDIIALGQFPEHSTFCAVASLRLRRVASGEVEGAAYVLPASYRPAPAVRVQMRSDSTFRQPPRMANVSGPVLVAVSAHGSASKRNSLPASTIGLTMAEVEGRRSSGQVGRSKSPSRRRRGEGLQKLQQFAPVGSPAAGLLAVNLGAAFCAHCESWASRVCP